MSKIDWHYSKDFMAYFFGVVPGSTVGSPEPQVLCSFGSMFNRTLVPAWTLQHCFDVCEDRVVEMRSRGIPHDAFCMCWYPRGNFRSFTDSTVFMRIQPSKHADQDTAAIVKELVNRNLVFILPQIAEVGISAAVRRKAC